MRLDDDGQTVTLDLHGAAVEEAVDLARRVVTEAARRGRTSVRLIHGASTSSTLYRNRSIKHGLQDLLDAGTLGHCVTDVWTAESYMLLSLGLAGRTDPRPLRLAELLR